MSGSSTLPDNYCVGRIKLVFDGMDGCIVASTRLLDLHLPPAFESYGTFKMAIEAVIDNSGQSFNVM